MIVLRASIDEREDGDVETEMDAVPFAISEEIADQYGSNYAISLDEQGMPVVTAEAG